VKRSTAFCRSTGAGSAPLQDAGKELKKPCSGLRKAYRSTSTEATPELLGSIFCSFLAVFFCLFLFLLDIKEPRTLCKIHKIEKIGAKKIAKYRKPKAKGQRLRCVVDSKSEEFIPLIVMLRAPTYGRSAGAECSEATEILFTFSTVQH